MEPISHTIISIFFSLLTFTAMSSSSSSLQSWVAEHKLAGIGALWAATLGASMAYSRKGSPMKTGLRIIHARIHAQALTLAVLSGAALYHYYDILA